MLITIPVLGGTSAVNALATIYPSDKTFKMWTELGSSGWDAELMTSYYQKFQTFRQPDHELEKELGIDYMNYNLYGKDGPVQTSISDYNTHYAKTWSKTFEILNGKTTTDPISGKVIGAFACPNYIDPISKTRSHAGVAYYKPISGRSNLHLIENALVEKINFSPGNSEPYQATGVQYVANGERHVVIAKKEIVLSAGAFGSPTILELSGVGDENLLKSLDIEVVIPNSNVGENLQDHPMFMMSLEAANDGDSWDSLSDPALLGEALRLLQEKKPGPLSGGLNAMAFMPVIGAMSSEEREKFKIYVSKLIDDGLKCESDAQKIKSKRIETILLDPTDSTAYLSAAPAGFLPEMAAQGIKCLSLVGALVHPLSQGFCHIQSKDPQVAPIIDPKYLSHPLDLEALAYHALQMSKLSLVEPLASMYKEKGRSNMPNGVLSNIDEAKIWLKEAASTQFHPTSTCAMMSRELGGVVNERLIVYGTTNLRVVDASIFPLVPKGPITSTVYAVAERASDMIKEDLKGT
jgi:choline dehydrogenase-like flavoprotein